MKVKIDGQVYDCITDSSKYHGYTLYQYYELIGTLSRDEYKLHWTFKNTWNRYNITEKTVEPDFFWE
jgi:hypothetical protein